MKSSIVLDTYLGILQENASSAAYIAAANDSGLTLGVAGLTAALLVTTYATKFYKAFKAKQIKNICSRLQGPDRMSCFQKVDNAALQKRVVILKKMGKEKCSKSKNPDSCKKYIQAQIQTLFRATAR